MTETKNFLFSRTKTVKLILFGLAFVQLFSFGTDAQTKNEKLPLPTKTVKTAASPQVTQVDANGLRNLLKTNGKPLLVNFWATWCDP
ncbi:MAG: hypothetical protein ACR2IA_02200, partial [Pyrinomonadaceae bacterium]